MGLLWNELILCSCPYKLAFPAAEQVSVNISICDLIVIMAGVVELEQVEILKEVLGDESIDKFSSDGDSIFHSNYPQLVGAGVA